MEFVTYWIFRFTNILLAPFFFHFGHHWLFQEIYLTVSELVDTVGFFYLLFYFIITYLIIRNATFQSYAKNFFKNYLNSFNILPLFTYFSFFYTNFLKSATFLINNIYLYFKNKNK